MMDYNIYSVIMIVSVGRSGNYFSVCRCKETSFNQQDDRYDVYFFICNFDYHVSKLLFIQISDSEYSEYPVRILYIYDGLNGYLYFWSDFHLRI